MEQNKKECGHCMRMVPASAEICLHCGEDVSHHSIVRSVGEAFHGFWGVVLSAIALAAFLLSFVIKSFL